MLQTSEDGYRDSHPTNHGRHHTDKGVARKGDEVISSNHTDKIARLHGNVPCYQKIDRHVVHGEIMLDTTQSLCYSRLNKFDSHQKRTVPDDAKIF